MCAHVGVCGICEISQLDAFRAIEEQCRATDKVGMDRDEVDANPSMT